MMKRTPYEAATMYDYDRWMTRDGVGYPVHELVIDTDKGACGVCRCDHDGTVALLGQVRGSWQASRGPLSCAWFEGVFQGAAATAEQRAQLLTSDVVQDGIWDYYRSRKAMDRDVFEVDGRQVPCSFLDHAFAPIESILSELLCQTLDLLDSLGVAEDEVRVMTVGQLAESAPARHAIRSALSADPFLADGRFAGPERGAPREDAVAVGLELLERNRTVGFDLALVCKTAQGEDASAVFLARQQQPLSALDEPTWCLPLFACGGDAIRFQCGDSQWQEDLPFGEGSSDCMMVEVACGLREGEPTILLRRADEPSVIHEIPIRM